MFLKKLASSAALFLAIAAPIHAQEQHLNAEIISPTVQIKKGEPFSLGVLFNIEPGWHIYWDNAGDSGLKTDITWFFENGIDVLKLNQTETPEKFNTQDIINYGFKDQTLYVTTAQTPVDFKGENLNVSAEVNYLICKDICLPGSVQLQKSFTLGDDTTPTTQAPYFVQFNKNAPSAEHTLNTSSTYSKNRHIYKLFFNHEAPVESMLFIPSTEGVIDDLKPQPFKQTEASVELSLFQDEYAKNEALQLSGILQINNKSYLVETNTKVEISEASASLNVKPFENKNLGLWQKISTDKTLQTYLIFALIGGLILNLMPCVLPVLSLKALSIIHHRKQGNSWYYGLIYTAGILCSFTVLAAIMVHLKSTGQDLGWGFQLQSPTFVAGLVLIITLVGLQLCGIFHIGHSLGRLQNLVSGHGTIATFLSGMLITLVATPCTAPFMGVAIAFALTQADSIIYLTFLTLGFGLALPYLLITFIPKAHKILPKAGAWELTLQRFLAFPMFATVLWLSWVYARQTSLDELFMMLTALFIIIMAATIFGHCNTFSANRKKRWFGAIVFISAIAYFFFAIHAFSTWVKNPDNEIKWSAWSTTAVEESLAQGRPVFVNFTADWCITCKVNEKVAINTEKSRQEIEKNGVKMLKGDWTSKDEKIAKELQKYNRFGVPLYLVFHPSQSQPQVLDQILTEGKFLQAIQQK